MVTSLMADGHIAELQHHTASRSLQVQALDAPALEVLPYAGSPFAVPEEAPRGADDAEGVALDRLGMGISAGCAVHCAATGALSLAPALAPSLAPAALSVPSSVIGWLEALEWPFLVGAAVVGVMSLLPALRRHHQRLPLSMFGVGIALVGASRFAEGAAEIALTSVGVLTIATAHVLNLRASRAARCAH